MGRSIFVLALPIVLRE